MRDIRQIIIQLVLLLSFSLMSMCLNAHTLIMTEIMHSNAHGIMDDLNELPDSWVELYNPSNDTLSTIGWKIGTTSNVSLAYTLTDSVKIPPHGFHLIYCDKKKTGNHTDFRIKSDGESELFLFDANNQMVDHVKVPSMLAPDISYGRMDEETKGWHFLMRSTPLRANDSAFSDSLLGNPKFSTKGGLFKQPFYLKIQPGKRAPKGTIIRYTTNGSEPDETSPMAPDSIRIDKTTIIRAKQFANGWHSPISKTHSYIFHNREITLPVISLVTDSLMLYDTTPTREGVLAFDYSEDWSAAFRRPCNVEYFPKEDSTSAINQMIELRVGGNGSRFKAMKSLNLYANKRFSKNDFNYPFWKEKPNVRHSKSIQLRNSGQDCMYTHFRDAVCQHTFCPYVNLDYCACQPCICYINGQYQGVLNIRERSNGDFVRANHHPQKKFDQISNWKNVHAGNKEEFDRLVALYNTEPINYDTLYKLIQMEEYINLQILNYIHINVDFPGNNSILWKEQDSTGAKWKWIAKDLDYGLGYAYRDWVYKRDAYLHHALRKDPFIELWSNKENQVKLFQVMMNNEKFRNEFIDRTTIYIGDFYTAERICTEIDSFVGLIKYEYPYMKALYPNLPEPNHSWEVEIQKTKEWINGRLDYLPYDMQQFFLLGDTLAVTFQCQAQTQKAFRMNDIPLVTQSFKGKYYKNRELRFSIEGSKGIWEIEKQYEDSVATERKEDVEAIVLTVAEDVKRVNVRFIQETGNRDANKAERKRGKKSSRK